METNITPESMFEKYKDGTTGKAFQKLTEVTKELKECGFIVEHTIEPLGEFQDYAEEAGYNIVIKRYKNSKVITLESHRYEASLHIPVCFG